jgi:hypothetical protein
MVEWWIDHVVATRLLRQELSVVAALAGSNPAVDKNIFTRQVPRCKWGGEEGEWL